VAQLRVVVQQEVYLVLGAEPRVVLEACLEPVIQPAVQEQEVVACLVLAVLVVEVASLALATLAAELAVYLLLAEVVACSAQLPDQVVTVVYLEEELLEEELLVFFALRGRVVVDQLDFLVPQAAQAVQAVAQLVGASLELAVQVLLLTS